MKLEAIALEILYGRAMLHKKLGHRVAKGAHSNMRLPIRQEIAAEIVLGPESIRCPFLRPGRMARRSLESPRACTNRHELVRIEVT